MTENRFTFAVDRKPEGRYALSRVGLIGLYVLFLVVGFCVFYAVRMPQVFAVCPLLLLILVFYTWRYTQVTNEYEIEIGQISFARIYGNRTRRNAMTLRIKDLVSAGPGKGGNGRYAHVYDFVEVCIHRIPAILYIVTIRTRKYWFCLKERRKRSVCFNCTIRER